MLSERVERLEKRMERVEDRLSSIEVLLAEIKGQLSQMPKSADLVTVRTDIARVDGRISSLPTMFQVMGMFLATGLTLLFATLRR